MTLSNLIRHLERHDAVMDNAGEVVRAARGDLSQAELARLTGLHLMAISKIERGDNRPTLETLRRIAAGLAKKSS